MFKKGRRVCGEARFVYFTVRGDICLAGNQRTSLGSPFYGFLLLEDQIPLDLNYIKDI